MLGSIELIKFRGFETYALTDFTRVNLLVGKNNCGKTSILEAIHFLVSGGDPLVLTQTAERRGEVSDASTPSAPGWRPDISHFFFGHRLEPGSCFLLSDGYWPTSAEVRLVDDNDNPRYFGGNSEEAVPFVLQIKSDAFKRAHDLPLTENGALLTSRISLRARQRNTAGRIGGRPEDATTPIEFVTPDSLDPDHMRILWDKVLTEDRESDVVDAMKLLDADLKSVSFLTRNASRTGSDRAGVLLGFQGGGRRVPLGSYGEGMRRLLALSLALTQTANGFLLIDEIDTGLHWTLLENMWRLVIETARKSSIQVFATTHSYDCIRGLAALAESHPELVRDVSIHKIERARHKAIRFAEDDIPAIVDQNIEVR